MRVVRAVERHIAEEGAGLMISQETHCFVGKHRTGMFRSNLRVRQFPIYHIAQRGLERVSHPAGEDSPGALKAQRERLRAVVPFACGKRRVAGLGECRRPGRVPQQLLVRVKQGLPREQHRPGGDARGAVEPALHIGAGKGHALMAQPVQVRRADHRVAERGNGIGALVVVEDEEDIGFVRREGGRKGQQQNQPNNETPHRPMIEFARLVVQTTNSSTPCTALLIPRQTARPRLLPAAACRWELLKGLCGSEAWRACRWQSAVEPVDCCLEAIECDESAADLLF